MNVVGTLKGHNPYSTAPRFDQCSADRPRFEVVHVPVPDAGYIVRDNHSWPCKRRYRARTFQPHSQYYETAAEAQHVADWLADRAARYPWNPLMHEWPARQPGDPAPPLQYRTRSG